MSQQPQQQKPEADPMVISYVRFHTSIALGPLEVEAWALADAPSPHHHGRVRIQERNGGGILVIYKAGAVYQEHTIGEGNLADVCRVPLSSLGAPLRAAWERAEKEVRR